MHHQNGPKMDPKWTQNGPKMDPKWSPKWTQNGPLMDPKWTHTVTHMQTHLEPDNTCKRGSPGPALWGPKGAAPKGWGPEGWGPRVGGPKFRAFSSLSRRKFHSFFSLGGPLVEFWWRPQTKFYTPGPKFGV